MTSKSRIRFEAIKNVGEKAEPKKATKSSRWFHDFARPTVYLAQPDRLGRFNIKTVHTSANHSAIDLNLKTPNEV